MASQLSSSVTLYEGYSTRMWWWYPHTNPYSGQTEGDYRGPNMGVACPTQLSTLSGVVLTLNQGCDNSNDGGIHYYADVMCTSGGSGTFEFWVQPWL